MIGTSVGTKNLTVSIKDMAGNEGEDSISIIVASSPSSFGSGAGGFKVLTNSSNKTFTNNKPEITAPYVDKETPSKGEIITCVPGKFSDKDGDVKAGDQWKWFVDGKEVYYGIKNTYDTSSANVGAKITCSQRATDGIDYSDWADSTNSATVQAAKKEVKAAAPAVTGETNKPVNPFTGAFIGGLLGDNIFIAILAVIIMGGAIAVLTIRFIKRRGLKVKVQ
jgi:hypothetical protein